MHHVHSFILFYRWWSCCCFVGLIRNTVTFLTTPRSAWRPQGATSTSSRSFWMLVLKSTLGQKICSHWFDQDSCWDAVCFNSINSYFSFRTGSKLGISPLMLAAMNGHVPAVKLLLDMGSDINAQIETNRNTALTLACFQGRAEVVSLLLDRKANVEHRAKVCYHLSTCYYLGSVVLM